MRRRSWPAVVLSAAALSTAGPAAGAPGEVAHAWTQVVPSDVAASGLQARAIVRDGDCPELALVTGSGQRRRLPMAGFAAPLGSVGFTGVRSCRAAIPAAAAAARVGGLRLPVQRAGWVAVIGDTGCRIKAAKPPKRPEPEIPNDCTSQEGWPFRTIARRIAAGRPGLVIHVGDYVYREADCPSAASDPRLHARCAGSPRVNSPGSPNPDNLAVWNADFFGPARAILRTAPLLPARGNHENCFRAGTGFVLFLAARADEAHACPPGREGDDHLAPYVVSHGDRRIAMVDSADAEDLQPADLDAYRNHLARAIAEAGRPGSWLVTHHPLFSAHHKDPVWINTTLQVASRDLDLVPRVGAVISGHNHLQQMVDVVGSPPQVIFGNGGTALEKAVGPPTPAPLVTPGGAPRFPGIAPYGAVRLLQTRQAWGYGDLRRERAGGWSIRARDVAGRVQISCRLAGEALDCGAPAPGT